VALVQIEAGRIARAEKDDLLDRHRRAEIHFEPRIQRMGVYPWDPYAPSIALRAMGDVGVAPVRSVGGAAAPKNRIGARGLRIVGWGRTVPEIISGCFATTFRPAP